MVGVTRVYDVCYKKKTPIFWARSTRLTTTPARGPPSCDIYEIYHSSGEGTISCEIYEIYHNSSERNDSSAPSFVGCQYDGPRPTPYRNTCG